MIEDSILMHYFLFLFIQVYKAARLYWILLPFEIFLVTLENPLCLLLLATTLHLLDVFRLLTVRKDSGFWRPITSLKQIMR
jgi:hypothetical protein